MPIALPRSTHIRLLFIAAAIPMLAARAQRVSGLVAGSAHGEVVSYARVELLDPRGKFLQVAMRTDTSGEFEIIAPKPGVYRLRASRPNYVTRVTDLFEIKADAEKRTVISLDLSPDALEGERGPSTAPRSPEFELRRKQGGGRFLTAPEIAAGGFRDMAALISSTPNAHVSCELNGLGDSCSATIRGGPLSSCYPAYYLNGVILARGPAMRPEDRVYGMAVDGLRAVEIYANAASLPGIYRGVGSDCGVIAIWTITPR